MHPEGFPQPEASWRWTSRAPRRPWRPSRCEAARPRSRPARRDGFIEGGTLFAHYSHKRKHFKTIAVDQLQGPCGSLQKKVAKFPFRPVKKGEWWIQFDNRRTYQRQQPPFVEHLTSVAKTIARGPKKCKRKRCPRR